MSIVVFWLTPDGQPAHENFESSHLVQALQATEARRKEGMRHVCISSELAESVGKPGVTAVSDGALPGGERYDWSKAHRGAGPAKK